MADRVRDKIAVVSGAGQGIGAAIATRLAAEGAVVIVTDIVESAAEATAASIRCHGGHAISWALDVADPAGWKSVVAATTGEYGRLDILVNNAGVGSFEGAESETVDGWNCVLQVNQTGVWLGMKYAIPVMRSHGGGSIVNICSTMGIAGDDGHFAYQATKGAIRTMSKNIAISHVAHGIRCNTVCPGMILTEMAGEEDDATTQEFLDLTPMHRHGTPDEVASGVLYLASDEASFVTGIDLVIDGGYLAR
ncbi:MAG: glucose 1-dehydrogenase [Nocardioides sp.]|uniref:SDR family NAD(P)-dependent oxidoreductase n=1 Tax=Nocardioides sp. TaxID=35761 RepID=UPI0039E69DB6